METRKGKEKIKKNKKEKLYYSLFDSTAIVPDTIAKTHSKEKIKDKFVNYVIDNNLKVEVFTYRQQFDHQLFYRDKKITDINILKTAKQKKIGNQWKYYVMINDVEQLVIPYKQKKKTGIHVRKRKKVDENSWQDEFAQSFEQAMQNTINKCTIKRIRISVSLANQIKNREQEWHDMGILKLTPDASFHFFLNVEVETTSAWVNKFRNSEDSKCLTNDISQKTTDSSQIQKKVCLSRKEETQLGGTSEKYWQTSNDSTFFKASSQMAEVSEDLFKPVVLPTFSTDNDYEPLPLEDIMSFNDPGFHLS